MKSASARIVPFPNPPTRDRDEIAFLPAALEIVESPPSPTGRAIGVTIIALFCLALGWAAFGKIDIVASAPGKIIANGRTKTIQPYETGVVRAIHVRDGMAVKAGDVLIELDTTMNLAERDHIKSDLIAAQLDIARLRAALSDAEDPVVNFQPPEGREPAARRHAAPVSDQPGSGAPAVHRAGDEKAWWQQAGIDPLKIARKLWKLTRMHEPHITSAAPTQDAAAQRPAASDRQVPGRPTTA